MPQPRRFVTPTRVARFVAAIGGLVLTQVIGRTSALGDALYGIGVALVAVTIGFTLLNEHRRERAARDARELAAEYDARLGVVLGTPSRRSPISWET